MNYRDMAAQSVTYVGKILGGAKPAALLAANWQSAREVALVRCRVAIRVPGVTTNRLGCV
jgi:hypothetical protein